MRRIALPISMLAVAIALVGCASVQAPEVASANGDKIVAEDDSDDGAKLDPQEQALKFAQCMRDHGIDMPDPEFDGKGGIGIQINGEGQSMEEVEKAMEACREYAPEGGEPPGPPDPQMLENMTKFSQCMRDNGVENFPDPDGGRMTIDGSVSGDPDFEAAQETCAKQFLPGATTTRTGPGATA